MNQNAIDQGPTLEEEVRRDILEIQALPIRTLNRPVGLIMQSTKSRDHDLQEKIVNIAQGWERVNWTLTEIRGLEKSLEHEETRLKIWILRFAARLPRAES